MNTWEPISDSDFIKLFDEQYQELNETEREAFDRYRVAPRKAMIRRFPLAGDEFVFVVAQRSDGVLYFDDIEYGFNISLVDESGKILVPGGSQYTLKQAVRRWMMPSGPK